MSGTAKLSSDERRRRVRARFLAQKEHPIPPAECGDCGDGDALLERHHTDYDKPTEIEWLCRACHGQRHSGNHELTARCFMFRKSQWEALRRMSYKERLSISEIVRDALEGHRPLRVHLTAVAEEGA